MSKTLSKSINFQIIAILTRLIKPFSFFFPKNIREMINFMPLKFPKKTLPKMRVYPAKKKKPVAMSSLLLTGCVQKVISPQINESQLDQLDF